MPSGTQPRADAWSNDVDIVVRSSDMVRAFDLLTRDGWQPAGSGTVLFHRSRLAEAVGINLVRGRFGNLDLHSQPFRPPYAQAVNEAAIWSRASAYRLGYVPVRVPSATDAVAIAIAHGALDAHKSSDWLADIAAGIDSGVDWDLLEALVEDCRLHAPAAVALGYVHDRLLRPVPAHCSQGLGKLRLDARWHCLARSPKRGQRLGASAFSGSSAPWPSRAVSCAAA